MPSSSTRGRRSNKTRWHLLSVSLCGLFLFGFCVFHGIHQSDARFDMEIASALALAFLGIYSGIYAFKHAHRRQRVIVALALALIISSLVTSFFLGNVSESPPVPRSPPDWGHE